MPRTARIAPAGVIFHVINRGVGRREIFAKDEDYAAFERVMAHARECEPLDLLAYCLMPNHWHMLLRPAKAGQLGRFMHRLTMTHTRRWQEHYHQVGVGHLYQSRFKSFPVQDDGHFRTVARYVERNALRARLVERAEAWPWSSLSRRAVAAVGRGMPADRPSAAALPLATWPVDEPSADWLAWVNEPQTPAELDAIRVSVAKGRPFGDAGWQQVMTRRLGLESSYRRAGRPRRRPAVCGKE